MKVFVERGSDQWRAKIWMRICAKMTKDVRRELCSLCSRQNEVPRMTKHVDAYRRGDFVQNVVVRFNDSLTIPLVNNPCLLVRQ